MIQTEQKYLIRDPMGFAAKELVRGLPVFLALLPEWQFFIRLNSRGSWVLTEVRSGAAFPPIFAETREQAVAMFNRYVELQGREECLRVFNKVIDQHGDLTEPQ